MEMCKRTFVEHNSRGRHNGSLVPLYCANRPPITLKDVQALARKRGGDCLSTRYVSARGNLRCRCSEGHIWQTKWNRLQQGMWCPVCGQREAAKRRRLTIDLMRDVARRKGGECLSKEYVNIEMKLLWQCRYGHQWFAAPANVNRGTWCPACAGRKTRPVVKRVNVSG